MRLPLRLAALSLALVAGASYAQDILFFEGHDFNGRRYGVSYMKQKSIDGRPYTVDHSSFTYLIGPDGKLAVTLPHGSSPEELVAAIRLQLTGKKNN